MRIYAVNDLHIEIGRWEPSVETVSSADLIVLAGDIGRHVDGLIWARDVFAGKRVVYVAGNHEFYGAEYHETRRELRRTARELEIDLLENDEVVIDEWKKDLLTAAFASHLDPLVAQADLWLHGHTHAFADHRIGDCRVVCNPRGYVVDGRALEATGWNPDLVVEV